MIVNIEPRHGRSFAKAGAYYLHDKLSEAEKTAGLPHPTTRDRVRFTHTLNCANDDPDHAIGEMIATFYAQDELKRAAGKALSGRQCTEPVKTMSLNWAPGETPSDKQMIEAAEKFLVHMGWQNRQALLVAHQDRAHPHLHIILNRVDPETGLTLKSWQEQKRASVWRTAYEQEQGIIRTKPAPAINDNRQPAPDLQPSGIPYPYAALAAESARQFSSEADANPSIEKHERELAADRHRQEREAFFATGPQQFRELCTSIFGEVRESYREVWKSHYREAAAARMDADARYHNAASQADEVLRSGDPDGAALAREQAGSERDDALKDIADAKSLIHQHQKTDTRTRQDSACKSLYDHRRFVFGELKRIQKEEREEIRSLQADRDEGRDYDQDRLQFLLRPYDPTAPSPVAGLMPVFFAQDNKPPSVDFDKEFANDNRRTLDESVAPQHEGTEPAATPPRRDAFTGIAGGIGALADATAKLLEGLFCPPSPREQALAKAVAKHRAETAPQREEDAALQAAAEQFRKSAALSTAAAEQHERDRREQWDDWQKHRRRGLER